MTNGIGIVGSTAGVVTPVVAAPAASNTSTIFNVPNDVTAPSITEQNQQRTVIDPSAGFITQYLSANGSQVVLQSPSAITVAYLRLGLTADGLSKPAQSVATTA